MTNDIDTLATALYVRTDDLLKQYPDLAPWRPAISLKPQLSDAELVTLAVMQALLGYTSESRWIRHARARLGHLLRRAAATVPRARSCQLLNPTPGAAHPGLATTLVPDGMILAWRC